MEIIQRIFNAVLIAALFCSIPEQSCAKAVAKTTPSKSGLQGALRGYSTGWQKIC
jgi:hypothetical protein